ncbi:MAG: hypothetical protein ACKO24_06015 [Leptolyngbyaceae cyanobacterium]
MTLKNYTAALSEEEQRLAIAKNYSMFSRPIDHYDFLELSGEDLVGTALF